MSGSIEIVDTSVSTAEAQEAARGSLDFLAMLAMPTVYQYAFPPLFLAIWEWLTTNALKYREFPQLALGLPRGFAKTTVIKIYILFCILFTQKKFILVICANASLAENILADVEDMLDEANIKKVFGDWRLGIEKNTQSDKRFGYRGRNITLAARGAGSSLRGIVVKNSRPDIIIFDDIQTEEQAESQIQSENLERWMYGTAMKTKSPHGCTFIFIANMYRTKWSLLKRLKHNPEWLKFVVGGILEDGSSLWEELQPKEQLIREFKNDLAAGHPEIFYSEVLNDDTAMSSMLIDLSKIPEPPMSEGDIPAGSFILIDPATDKPGSDACSIGYAEVHNTIPVLMEVIEGHFSPGETIRTAVQLAISKGTSIIGIEGGAYQSTLAYWFRFICAQMGIEGIEAVEVLPGGRSKNTRIIEALRSYATGETSVGPRAKAAVHYQITQFNPLKKDNVDGILDLLTYMSKMLELYGAAIATRTILAAQQDTHIYTEDENCSF